MMSFGNLNDPIERLPEEQRDIVRRHQSDGYVELGPLFSELGVAYERVDLGRSISGEATYSKGASPTGFIVRVNSTHPIERQRFTAAHELGHCLVDGDDIKMRSESDPLLGPLNRVWEPEYCNLLMSTIPDPFADALEERQETEANRFASNLLIPAPFLNKRWRAGFKDLKFLAGEFGVSEQAMKRRFRELKS